MGAGCSRWSAIGLRGWVEGAIGVLGSSTLFAAPGIAQIVPDSSLGTESSVVTPDATVQGAPADLIEGGAVRGENLFHSFEDFNVNTRQRVYFANPLDIENILSRVTGGDLSNIDGLLGVDGGANLFLLNPNGVVFGPNARLDIRGSFTTSTANGFAFTDGSEFSAGPSGNELLSVSVPLGVQLNDTLQGDIENSGDLAVGAGETLTLLGNSVLSRGALTASGGTVQVLGNQVGLVDQATIDVSSAMGGGAALIGGNYQGQGDLPTAQQTRVESGVQITADTLEVGDGGTVIVWADGITEFAGSIAARGGPQGGNGGFVETSGRQTLIVAPSAQVDASAFQGAGGLWLLDPSDITIDAATATTLETSLASGTSIELSTVGGTGGVGDITLASSINANATNNATLSLTASRSIAPAGNAVIDINGGNLTLNLNQEVEPTTPTLNNALATINTVSGNVTVNLGVGTYQEGAPIILNQDVMLNGVGADSTIVSGSNVHQVLNVTENADVTISDISIMNGNDNFGGGISNSGLLTINDSTIRNNTALSGGGGGIANNNGGTLTIAGSTISNNTADVGGGIFNGGTLIITDSTIRDNQASDSTGSELDGFGGGIFNGGTLTITDSTIRDNQADAAGGGVRNGISIAVPASLTITGSTVSGNESGGSGGGILNFGGILEIANTTVTGNIAEENGGGIYINSATSLPAAASISNTTIRDNEATQYGGGILNRNNLNIVGSTIEGNNAQYGGGIANRRNFSVIGTLTITSSTISNNTADDGGGIFNTDNNTLTITSSTISDNQADASGGGVSNMRPNDLPASDLPASLTINSSTVSGNTADDGGGIFNNDGGTLTITTSTISGNTADNGGGGFALRSDSTLSLNQSTVTQNEAITGSGIQNDDGGQVALSNTIVSGNIGDDISGSFDGAETNLIGGSTLLSALGNYGGTTQTHALLPGSPAIDAGSGTETDQRGITVVNGTRDIGAFESQGFEITASEETTPQTTNVTQPFPEPLSVTVSSAFGEPVAGGTVTFTVPETGASATLSENSVTLDGSGQASVMATANTSAGSYLITASTSGANTDATFNLTNILFSGFTVDTFIDENNGDVTPGNVSLREAILFTETGGTVRFDPALSGNIITLGLGELTIDRNLTVNGLGADSLSISGDDNSRVFNVTGNNTIAIIRDLTITEGNAEIGGAIRVNTGSTLTIENSEITDSTAQSYGGGIDNSGTLTVTNSIISGNTAADGNGGGIGNYGSAVITNSTLTDNVAELDGGGIDNSGTVTLAGSTLTDNTAMDDGGGIDNDGMLTVTDSIISGNRAEGGNGGGIINDGNLTITNSTLNNNSADDYGGGVSSVGSLVIENTTLSDNSADIGAGIYGAGMLQITDITSDDIETAAEGTTNLNGTIATSGDQRYRNQVTARTNLNLIGDDIFLENTNTLNIPGNLRIEGDDVELGGVVDISGALNITSTGIVEQTGGSLSVDGTTDIRTSETEAGDVDISSTTGLNFSLASVGGDLTLITPSVNGTGQVAGTTTVNGNAGVNPLRDITTSAIVTQDGDNYTVTGSDTIDLSTVTGLPSNIPGNLEVTATGEQFVEDFSGEQAIDLTQNNNQFGGALVIVTDTPATEGVAPTIRQSDALTVDGTLTLDATPTGDIQLDNPTNSIGIWEIDNGNDVSLATSGDATLNASTIRGDLTVSAGGPITDDGDLNVAGTATFNAGSNTITLDSSNNQFGTVELAGSNVSVTENSATNLGDSSISGTLTVNSSGDITDSGDVSVGGTTTLNANDGANDITLNSSNNQFGLLELTGDTVSIRENAVASLGSETDIGGNLSITATDVELNDGNFSVQGNLILQPFDEAQTVTLGADTAPGFSLSQAEIASLSNITALDSITIGSDSGSGSVTWTLDAVTNPSVSDPFDVPLTLRSPAGGVNINAPSLLSLSDVTVEANSIVVTAIGDVTLTDTQLLGQSDADDISTIDIDTDLNTSDRRDLFLVGDSQIEAPDGIVTLLVDNVDATEGTNSDVIAGIVVIRSTFDQELINIFEQTTPTDGNDIISTGFLQDPSGFDPSEGVNELPVDLEDASDRIQTGCGLGNTNEQSEFIITGRGGLPPGPSNLNTANRVDVPWVTEDDTPSTAVSPPVEAEAPLVEAQSIQVDENGNIYFVTDNSASTSQSSDLFQSRRCTDIL